MPYRVLPAVALALVALAFAAASRPVTLSRVVGGDDAGLGRRLGILTLAGAPYTGLVAVRGTNDVALTLRPYRDGRQDGSERSWYPNGRLASVRRYQRGEKSGPQEGFWPNGRQRFHYNIERGVYEGSYLTWHDNKRIAEVLKFAAGTEAGAQRSWDRNGVVLSNYVAKNGRRYGYVHGRPCFTVHGGVS